MFVLGAPFVLFGAQDSPAVTDVSGTEVLANIGLVFLFVIIGGVFAAAEIALVSLREGQVRQLAQSSKRGRTVARLANDPNRFLSAVQIGVTFAGFLSAAFGGAVLAGPLAPHLAAIGIPAPGTVALVLVTVAISYVSIVLGELTAKRLALQRAEAFALVLGPVMDRLAWLLRPLIWLLSVSTNAVVRLLGGDPSRRAEQMSQAELRDLVASNEELGEHERAIVSEVFAAGDQMLREVMVPRTDVDFLDVRSLVREAVDLVRRRPHARYPVARGVADDVVGFVHVRDLLNPDLTGSAVRVESLVRPVMFLPGTKRVIPALTEMRDAQTHLAVVLDEYGSTAGIITLEDLIEELIGDITDEYDIPTQEPSRRLASGETDVDGRLNLEDFAEETGLRLPEGPYETIAGFVVAGLGHIPRVGEYVAYEGYRITITECDGQRVARVRVRKVDEAVG